MSGAIWSLGQSDEFEGAFGALDVDVRDGDDVDAGDVVGLRKVHGAVAAGSDQADPDGAAFLFTVAEEFVKIHWSLSGRCAKRREALPRQRMAQLLCRDVA